MKRAALAVGTILMMLPIFAVAQTLGPSDHIVSKVPFQFMVGDKLVPAGECVIRPALPNSSILQMQNPAAKVSVPFTITTDSTETMREGYSLIFHKYGDHYFLSAIRLEGNTIEWVPEGKLEAELRAQGAKPSPETTIAALR
jgi:hypothetical protein